MYFHLIRLACFVVLSAGPGLALAAPPDLPFDARPLDWPEEDLSGRMMDGTHRFVEQQIAEAQAKRDRYWKYDRSSAAAWNASIHANRDRLREIAGAVDPRLPPRMERFGDDRSPALVAETTRYRVYQVRWSVLEGLSAEGLLIQPKTKPVAHLVVLPDCDQTSEQILGLAPGLAADRQYARRLAENGFEIVIPALIDRRPLETSAPQIKRSEQPSREWLYRQAFHMGRHIIGYEVQKTLAAVDWFIDQQDDEAQIGVLGHGEGGLIAFYSAALDTRIDAA